MSDFGPISAVKHVISRHSLQVGCWFLDNNVTMDQMDRMNTSFSGQEGVSHEINAKYLIFDDFSDSTRPFLPLLSHPAHHPVLPEVHPVAVLPEVAAAVAAAEAGSGFTIPGTVYLTSQTG